MLNLFIGVSDSITGHTQFCNHKKTENRKVFNVKIAVDKSICTLGFRKSIRLSGFNGCVSQSDQKENICLHRCTADSADMFIRAFKSINIEFTRTALYAI